MLKTINLTIGNNVKKRCAMSAPRSQSYQDSLQLALSVHKAISSFVMSVQFGYSIDWTEGLPIEGHLEGRRLHDLQEAVTDARRITSLIEFRNTLEKNHSLYWLTIRITFLAKNSKILGELNCVVTDGKKIVPSYSDRGMTRFLKRHERKLLAS